MLDEYLLGRRGTQDTGSVTTPDDDRKFGGQGGAEEIEVGCELLITSGTRDGDLCRISKKPNISGLITCDPPPAGNLSAGDTFEVLYKQFRFEYLHAAIDQALADHLWEKLLVPITSVTDGDMLGSGVGDWTVSNSAQSKSAASFPLALRELHVENSSANGYTASASIPVEAGETYFFEATARVTASPATNTARLVLRDLTNGANITLDNASTTEQEPTILWNPTTTIPDNCELVEIRLGEDEADGDALWSNIAFRKNSSREFVIQDRMSVDRLGPLKATGNDQWAERGNTMWEISAEPEMRSSGIWVYRIGQSGSFGHSMFPLSSGGGRSGGRLGGLSLWYEEFRRRGALTSDSSTTSVPKEELAAVAAAIVLEPLRDKERWETAWSKASRDAEGMLAPYRDSLRTYTVRTSQMPMPRV